MKNTEFYLEASCLVRQAMDVVFAMKITKEQREALKSAYVVFEEEIWKCANIPNKEEKS